MPVGCIHHFIVVKRSAVMDALEIAVQQGDQERQKVARLLLSRLHSDDYLIALEDMAETDDDVQMLEHLGLQGHDGNEWLDYYAPRAAQLPAHWLLYAPIREIRSDGTYGQVIWSGYKHVQDHSTLVAVWEDEDYPAKPREPFPFPPNSQVAR